MAQRIKTIHKYTNGNWDSGVPIGADAENIDVRTNSSTTVNLQTVLGVDSSETPQTTSIQGQLNSKVASNGGDISSTEIADASDVIKYDLNDAETSKDLISEDLSQDTDVVVMGGSGESTATMWSKFNRFRKRVDNKFKTYFSDNLATAISTTGTNTTAYSTTAINNYLSNVIGYTSASTPSAGNISSQLSSLNSNKMPKAYLRASTSSAITLAQTTKSVEFTNDTVHYDTTVFGLTNNGALSFKKSGTYAIIIMMGINGVTAGDAVSLLIQKWTSASGITDWDGCAVNAGGSYCILTYMNSYYTTDSSSAFFIGARNNTTARGSCGYCRVLVWRLGPYPDTGGN